MVAFTSFVRSVVRRHILPQDWSLPPRTAELAVFCAVTHMLRHPLALLTDDRSFRAVDKVTQPTDALRVISGLQCVSKQLLGFD